ncbi:hypothetical protein TraAM80_04851 [Trypanosoma rangeli]|uniref:Uncharacterized protein n=1 Tax=Trypanosoma rangeli TaxID=5698 RepID=A0A3R7NE49_TRYRA|nr:uncharacterized protein TraAM80_04851 [Trypanosoma rangeli]RNF05121.1 hypothetical protein TraAM80_04851 [Trypanosoma rangeli]|eukprot:RNF05121.1 hypothetical protein TraAM80_04851 [Trypanosoma rangeli]
MFTRGPLTVAQAERVCKWYFRAGFIGLPWLWFANWLLFRHHAGANSTIAWYTTASLRLGLAGGLLLVVWYVAVMLAVPATSSLFVLPPFTGKWQPGHFAT